jgi:hypothetical protein
LSWPHPPKTVRHPLSRNSLGAAADLEVGGDAQVAPLPVGVDPRDVIPLNQTNRVAARQKAEGRFIQAGDADDAAVCLNTSSKEVDKITVMLGILFGLFLFRARRECYGEDALFLVW